MGNRHRDGALCSNASSGQNRRFQLPHEMSALRLKSIVQQRSRELCNMPATDLKAY